MKLISRLARAAVLLGAVLLAGCQSLPNNIQQPSPLPPQGSSQASEPTPSEKSAEEPPPQAVEQALSTYISRKYVVASTRATHVVRAAGRASKRTGLARTLILAVIAVESSFDPMAVSSKGARGLMQVMPEYHPDKIRMIGGEQMLHEVESGIQVGARILREYQLRSGDLRQALRRYSGAATNYADKVLARKREFDRFAGLLAGIDFGGLPQPFEDVLSEIAALVDASVHSPPIDADRELIVLR